MLATGVMNGAPSRWIAQAARHGLRRVRRAAVALEQRDPLVRQHVGVDVDDRAAGHCSLMLAAFTTSPHFFVSSRIIAANSCGVVGEGSAPADSARSRRT